MDDDTHNVLCNEFIKIAQNTNINYDNVLISIIDNDWYKDIFTYNNLSHHINLIQSIYNMTNLGIITRKDIICHIVTTRKLANINKVRYIILPYLTNESSIAQFFSFYNNDEITDFVNYPARLGYTCFINERYVKITTIFLCISYENKLLFNYLLQHMATNNLSIVNYIPYDGYINNMPNMKHPRCHYYFTLINDHEENIIYLRSLRNAWLTACTTYIKYVKKLGCSF